MFRIQFQMPKCSKARIKRPFILLLSWQTRLIRVLFFLFIFFVAKRMIVSRRRLFHSVCALAGLTRREKKKQQTSED